MRQVRGAEEPFRSHLAPALGNGSDILGRLVSEMYLHGLSTRDVENMFIEVTEERIHSDDRPLVTRSSRCKKTWWQCRMSNNGGYYVRRFYSKKGT